jgi:hypothetical protein
VRGDDRSRTQFVCEKDLLSQVIAWFSAGHVSHVDIVLDDGQLLGARSDVSAASRPEFKSYAAFAVRVVMAVRRRRRLRQLRCERLPRVFTQFGLWPAAAAAIASICAASCRKCWSSWFAALPVSINRAATTRCAFAEPPPEGSSNRTVASVTAMLP